MLICNNVSIAQNFRVFENCRMYNGTDSEVGRVGVAISLEFKQLVTQYQLEKFEGNSIV
jgi:hypothetical protein